METISEGIRKLLLAGVGAVATTADKSKEILDELVEKGELTVEQGRALNQDLKHTLMRDKDATDRDFEKFVADLSPDELEELKIQIRKAEESDV